MSYRRQITRGRRGLGNGFTDWMYNASTGKLTDSQVNGKISECAASNYRAGGGRITMDEARAQCDADIRAVRKLNDRDADNHTLLIVGGLFLAGLLMVTRR
ncbi:MAG: hypothetical protein CXZ00_03035 [Acidobacteria bacterium]|nr:MAG: hypothetical protein CXZ00_03035 [Acidobacteriota bacterium]